MATMADLASRILALMRRKLPGQWEQGYGVRLLLMETFCEIPRPQGTDDKAASWLRVGEPRGRDDRFNQALLSRGESIWHCPIQVDSNRILNR